MFFLVTGASGSGKSTARRLAEPNLPPNVACAELAEIVEIPANPDHRWRQQATEQAVEYALQLQRSGRHLLLAGDPVAIGEVLASPSATQLEGIAACLLHVDPDSQTARLTERGDDPSLLPNHHGFAEWMRGHVRDPQHRQFVIVEDGWEQMQWQRWDAWPGHDPRWQFAEIDTTSLEPEVVAAELVSWVRRVLSGDSPALRGAWWD
jgi:hypothetical protein